MAIWPVRWIIEGVRFVNVLAVGLVLALAGCGSDGPDPVELPSGAVQMITWNVTGGFGPAGLGPADPIRLAVYSDGRAIAGAEKVLTVPTEELRDLIRRVREIDGLPPTAQAGTDRRVADGQDTTIGVRLRSGDWRTVSAYAIDIDPVGYPERLIAADTALRALAERVKDEGEAYTADRVRVVVLPIAGTSFPQSWPAAVPVPTQPAPGPNPLNARQADLTGDGAATVARMFGDGGRGGDYDSFRLPDGSVVNMAWRYLLPDE